MNRSIQITLRTDSSNKQTETIVVTMICRQKVWSNWGRYWKGDRNTALNVRIQLITVPSGLGGECKVYKGTT